MDIIQRLNQFSYTNEEVKYMNALLEMGELSMHTTPLNEAFSLPSISGLLDKVGIAAHSTGPGLLQMLAKAGKNIGMLFYYTLKYMAGDKAMGDKIKELTTSLTKEEVLDFLLKLDAVTLHLLTGPIHMIDALTGWHIWANIHHATKNVTSKAKEALQNLLDVAKHATDQVKRKLKSIMQAIVTMFGFDDQAKAIQAI